MKEQLEKIRQEALGALESVKDAGELDALRVRFLGKKGELTGVLKMMGKLSAEERPAMGQAANTVRAAIEEKIETVRAELKEKAMEARLEAEAIDVTIPGTPVQLGHRHPMNKALDEAKDIFISMGFKILDGPEVELADYNFTKLNIAENHPSRDRSDTFYITDDEEVLLEQVGVRVLYRLAHAEGLHDSLGSFLVCRVVVHHHSVLVVEVIGIAGVHAVAKALNALGGVEAGSRKAVAVADGHAAAALDKARVRCRVDAERAQRDDGKKLHRRPRHVAAELLSEHVLRLYHAISSTRAG